MVGGPRRIWALAAATRLMFPAKCVSDGQRGTMSQGILFWPDLRIVSLEMPSREEKFVGRRLVDVPNLKL